MSSINIPMLISSLCNKVEFDPYIVYEVKFEFNTVLCNCFNKLEITTSSSVFDFSTSNFKIPEYKPFSVTLKEINGFGYKLKYGECYECGRVYFGIDSLTYEVI